MEWRRTDSGEFVRYATFDTWLRYKQSLVEGFSKKMRSNCGCGVLLLLGASFFAVLGCGSRTGTPTTTANVHNEWTWKSGSSSVNQAGIYGALNVAESADTPGARSYPAHWTDASGNFWLFGGYGYDSTGQSGDLNDLWEYSNGEWKWVGGSSQTEQGGSYGLLGVAAADNWPGARYEPVSWTDSSGNLWLFGGLGIDGAGNRNNLNDLWKFSQGQWAWMAGSSNTGDQKIPGVYGTQGVPDSANTPGNRIDAQGWADTSGNIWLFGGEGPDVNGDIGLLNDLWEFTQGKWVWMGGSNTYNPFGIYGTKGAASPTNMPGARVDSATWRDASGTFWLFGGEGNDLNGVLCEKTAGPCELSDLWKYSKGQWTWVSGADVVEQPGSYGAQGVAAANNVPGGRESPATWIDSSGNLWLFGGVGFDSSVAPGVFGDLNDLWKYSGGEWIWVSGSNSATQTAVYGTEGAAAAVNMPGGRDRAVGWTDMSGNLWLFGGINSQYVADGGVFNDLWEYQP